MNKAIIVLEDGRVFEGKSFGADGERFGEIVFNTSMMGYQEILTDPSYKRQIVVMTYPLIGNYGVNSQDFESSKVQAEGFVVKEYSKIYSNWRAEESLGNFLVRHGILALEGIDTRTITKHIRSTGAMKAVISTTDFNIKNLVEKVRNFRGLIGVDLVKEVTLKESIDWNSQGEYRIVIIDCGMKYNIANEFVKRNCKVWIVPYDAALDEIIKFNPDGIVISNGPGDPAAVLPTIETTKKLIEKRIPIFGICLGHQLLGLALNGKTYKLKFGHRGANQPVKDLESGRVYITSQNHGFCVDINSLKHELPHLKISHINLNDNTLEGMRHTKRSIYSVQYHPEASPGPNDTKNHFDEFIKMLKSC